MLKRGFSFFLSSCFYLLASGPAASSLEPLVTLGGLSSSQRDMASSLVVALFRRSSIDAIRVSNEALGIYRVGALSSRLRPLPRAVGLLVWTPGLEKGRRGRGGLHGRGHSYRVGISQREADKELFNKDETHTNHVKRHSALDDGGKKGGLSLSILPVHSTILALVASIDTSDFELSN